MPDMQSPFLTPSWPDGATEWADAAPETSPEIIPSEHEDDGFDEYEGEEVWLGEIADTENAPEPEPQQSRSEQSDPGTVLDGETEALLGDLWDSAKTMWERALVGAAIAKGERRDSNLTNLVFSRRHPERTGRPLSPDEPGFHGLAAEWKEIRDSIVQPALARSASAPTAPTAPTSAVTGTSRARTSDCVNLPTLSELRTLAIANARAEALHWTDAGLSETNASSLPRLREFWLTVQGPHSPNMRPNDARSYPELSQTTKAWSAVFISWCYVKAYADLNPQPGWRWLVDYAGCLRANGLFAANSMHLGYVNAALATGNYELVDHTREPVERGDWIYRNRVGGTHVDLVLDVFETSRGASIDRWALSAGGNISTRHSGKRGVTAGFKIHTLDGSGLLTAARAMRSRPDDAALSAAIGLRAAQISGWPNVSPLMNGLVRLTRAAATLR